MYFSRKGIALRETKILTLIKVQWAEVVGLVDTMIVVLVVYNLVAFWS